VDSGDDGRIPAAGCGTAALQQQPQQPRLGCGGEGAGRLGREGPDVTASFRRWCRRDNERRANAERAMRKETVWLPRSDSAVANFLTECDSSAKIPLAVWEQCLC